MVFRISNRHRKKKKLFILIQDDIRGIVKFFIRLSCFNPIFMEFLRIKKHLRSQKVEE